MGDFDDNVEEMVCTRFAKLRRQRRLQRLKLGHRQMQRRTRILRYLGVGDE
jgi:hypothetical protein